MDRRSFLKSITGLFAAKKLAPLAAVAIAPAIAPEASATVILPHPGKYMYVENRGEEIVIGDILCLRDGTAWKPKTRDDYLLMGNEFGIALNTLPKGHHGFVLVS